MDFRIWFLSTGAVITAWLCYIIALGLFISAIWDKGKKARTAGAMGFLFVGTVLLIVQILPFNWQVLYNIGGIK